MRSIEELCGRVKKEVDEPNIFDANAPVGRKQRRLSRRPQGQAERIATGTKRATTGRDAKTLSVPGPWLDWIIAAALALSSFLLYLPTFSFGFVDYDDPKYVTENPVVQRGLTLAGIKWAFTTTTFANWLPVTWLSHMLDCQLYGLEGGGHHATSTALHAINAALVFLLLRMMTGQRWRSAIVAGLFAFHPLRVESVVWIAERKDVLSATFFLLTVLAYVYYYRGPNVGRYALMMLAYALGLMSKTMLVTLPCVLLLLDYWPLGRVWTATISTPQIARKDSWSWRRIGWLVLEKLPLFGLAAISAAWTVVLQRQGGAFWGEREFTPGERIANALVSVPRYLAKTVRPVDLAVFYPHPAHWPAWQVIASAALIVGITIFVLLIARRRPYAPVGWLWFLGMLVPVSGIMQVGLQAMADRYMYLPSIGLFIAVVWGAADALEHWPRFARPARQITGVVLGLLALCTVLQEGYWRSTLDLFTHALVVDPGNWEALDFVGLLDSARGDDAAAVEEFRKSIAGNPGHPIPHAHLATSLMHLGRVDEAIEQYREALRLQPGLPTADASLARALAARGRYEQADVEYARAAQLQPNDAQLQTNWGQTLLKLKRRVQAAEHFRSALRLDPNQVAAREGLVEAGVK